MFMSRQTEAVLAALRAENTDLRTQLRLEREEAAQREKALLDRILALTNPGALRVVARAAPGSPSQEPVSPIHSEHTSRRLNYPGYPASTRPPSPSRTSPAPDASSVETEESAS